MKKSHVHATACGIGGMVILVASNLAFRLPAFSTIAIPVAFALGGLTAGALLRQGGRPVIGFALGFCAPGVLRLMNLANSSESGGTVSLLIMHAVGFAVAWAAAGAVGTMASGLGKRRIRAASFGFALGGGIGGAIMGMTVGGLFGPAGVFVNLAHALSLIIPCLGGGLALDLAPEGRIPEVNFRVMRVPCRMADPRAQSR